MIELVIGVFATYGISKLITSYDGLWGVFLRLRDKFTTPFNCTVCTAVWVAVPIALFAGVGILGYLAIIGAVILIERVVL